MSDRDVDDVIRDYQGDGDFEWTDIEVGVLVAEIEHLREQIEDAAPSPDITERADPELLAEVKELWENRLCGVVSQSGSNLEPLACGYKKGHDGAHAWATLPVFPLRTIDYLKVYEAIRLMPEWKALKLEVDAEIVNDVAAKVLAIVLNGEVPADQEDTDDPGH